ncbi:hypothetical protein PsorP6_013353 [Peronosclerospora sorghi]|uniref:Uncharacterized protein n=1 Tax=Peronosclerospora sorghi TaxID=230839 RepID=A0ACC0WIL5_9STRA|nr:hypothetical protein PsorP6_013353 [Peronosclerospora sorghi]
MRATLSIALAVSVLYPADGCSDFLLSRDASTTSVISGRTMDFHADLESALEVIPRWTQFQEPPASGCPECPDFGWQNKLGFVAANVYGFNVATDGLNEAGLSAAWLYLETSEYPVPKSGASYVNRSKPIVTSLCSYILGNFETVEQLKKGLEEVQLAGIDSQVAQEVLRIPAPADGKRESAPLHVSVHDRNGKNLVIEFLNGTTIFYDNPNGVLTNDPPLDEQLNLLHEYMEKDTNSSERGYTMPGGYSSTERFVRLSVLNEHVRQGYSTPTEQVSYLRASEEQLVISEALHLLNTVVSPQIGGATQWSIVRDHTRKMLYFRSTANQLLRRISLDMLDMANPHARRLIPVSYGKWFLDSTRPLLDEHNVMRTKDLPPRSKLEAALIETQVDETSKQVESTRIVDTAYDQPKLVAGSSQLQRADKLESLSLVWVFMLGSIAGGIMTALMLVGLKTIPTGRYRRRDGYEPIAEV